MWLLLFVIYDVRMAGRPNRFVRWLYAAPVPLYRAGMGWLLGSRFLLLTHTGRVSGLLHQVVLEVIRYDRESETYYVAAAFGERTNWLRNIQRTPPVTIQVGNRRHQAIARQLSPSEAADELRRYVQRHPIAARFVAYATGHRLTGNEADLERLANEMPLVAFTTSTGAVGGDAASGS